MPKTPEGGMPTEDTQSSEFVGEIVGEMEYSEESKMLAQASERKFLEIGFKINDFVSVEYGREKIIKYEGKVFGFFGKFRKEVMNQYPSYDRYDDFKKIPLKLRMPQINNEPVYFVSIELSNEHGGWSILQLTLEEVKDGELKIKKINI